MNVIPIKHCHVVGLKFVCPLCGQKMDVGREYFNTELDCPTCQARLRTPDLRRGPDEPPIKRLPRTHKVISP